MRLKIACLLLSLSLPVVAEPPNTAFGVKVGLQGLTLQLRPRMAEDWFARINYSVLNASASVNSENGELTYTGSIRSRNRGILVDYHPWGSFRFTAGMHIADVKGTGTARCNELFCTIGDSTFTPLQLGTLNIEYDVGPRTYLFAMGVTTNRNEAGWGFDAELGIQWRPDVNVELFSTGGLCQIDPFCIAKLERDEKAYEERLEYIPALSFGMYYSF